MARVVRRLVCVCVVLIAALAGFICTTPAKAILTQGSPSDSAVCSYDDSSHLSQAQVGRALRPQPSPKPVARVVETSTAVSRFVIAAEDGARLASRTMS